jgi:hypothetical protein
MIVNNSSATFPRLREAAQIPQTVNVVMSAAVSQATAILTGFNVQFSTGGDHHLGRWMSASPPGHLPEHRPVTVFFDLRIGRNRDDYYEDRCFSVS